MALSRWTDEMDATLRRLWSEPISLRALAERLGYSEQRLVTRRARRLGLPERPAGFGTGYSDWTDDRIAELRKLWSDGLSCSQIGKALGVTRNAIIGKVHRLGLAGRGGDNDGRFRAARIAERAKDPTDVSATKARRHGPKRGEPARNGFGAIGLPPAKPRGRPRKAEAGPPPIARLGLVEIPEPDSAFAVPFGERLSAQCCWPMWTGEQPLSEMLVCGAAVVPGHGRPYCAHHLVRSAGAPLTPALSRKGRGGREETSPARGKADGRAAA